MVGQELDPYPPRVRLRRFLWLWCVALAALSVAALAGPGEAARSQVVTTAGQGAAPGAVTDDAPGPQVLAATAEEAPPATPAPPSSSAPPAPPTTGSRSPSTATRSRTTAPPSAGPLPPRVEPPPVTAPVLADDGSIPCKVMPASGSLTLANGQASAGAFGPGISLDNCRPVVGDVVGVQAFASTPGAAMRVSFGDGATAGADPSDCSFPSGQVTEEHRYTKPGRYLLEAIEFVPCIEWPERRYKAWIEVSAGVVPQAPGAEACRNLGVVKPGEPARHGITTRGAYADRFGIVRATLNRCSVPVGGQAELAVYWYEPSLAIDWGDGSPPQAFHQKGHQGASVLHTFTRKGLHVVRVWIIVDGTPTGPTAFSVLVS
jgi:hypothetical protein